MQFSSTYQTTDAYHTYEHCIRILYNYINNITCVLILYIYTNVYIHTSNIIHILIVATSAKYLNTSLYHTQKINEY